MEDLDEEDEAYEVFFKTTYKAPNLDTNGEKMEERRREKSIGWAVLGVNGMNSFEFIQILIRDPFTFKPFSSFYLHLESNEMSFYPILAE